MRRKRGYTRELPDNLLRDYKLFAIACEGGKREPQYFSVFKYLSTRIAVDIIEDSVSDDEMQVVHQTKSAPRWVLDRALKYIDKEGLSVEDELWFVLDTDRWLPSQIHEIAQYCMKQSNWHIALSNPCFEIWLYFHKKGEIKSSKSKTCADLKTEIATLAKGGYHPLKFILQIDKAIENARAADTNKIFYLPNVNESKVYLLAEKLMSFASKKDVEYFLSKAVPRQIEASKSRVRF